ncbi:MAG: sortase [Anaerolineaceae bacterium]|nr:sortase [Anaerolineaceae bacterium]
MKQTKRILTLFLIAFFVCVPIVLAALGDTTRVSLDSSNGQANDQSESPTISADGRYVAFASYASNLVAGDTNGRDDIFVHDRTTGATTRVSLDSSGGEAIGGGSNYPTISADGRYVAFTSYASNLVAGDTNGADDIFVHDRTTGATTRISLDSSGVQANGYSNTPSISWDGRYVAFVSTANNLVAGDTNGRYDIFVHDRNTGATTRVSVDSSNGQGNGDSSIPTISADGRYVAFVSNANNLVAGDTNGTYDIFVHDRTTGATTRVSLDSSGGQASGSSGDSSISADGRYVAFHSAASNLVAGDTNGRTDVFVHDRTTGATTRVSLDSSGGQANAQSESPTISADGRYVVFESDASNLGAVDTNGAADIFVHDRNTGVTTRVSLDSSGGQANAQSESPAISADGRYVVFESDASNLVAGDTNGATDVFVHEPDFSPPTVMFGTGSVPNAEGATLSTAPTALMIRFSQDMLSDGGPHAANALVNYMLLRPGVNAIFDTAATSLAICDASHTPEGDDELISISGITYTSADHTATLTIASAFSPLADGQYRLYVCGAQSIWNLRSIPLNNRANSTINFRVENVTNPANTGNSDPVFLPATGFAPGQMTLLPPQDVIYTAKNDLRLEIPELAVDMSIVGVPLTDGTWDVAWLGEKAGWLQGTAYPTWAGNAVITGHVWNADNTGGPFQQLSSLRWGDEIVVHLAGQAYVYEVRSVRQVAANNVKAMLKHEELPWLTLVTCKGYDEDSGSYRSRVLVRAVLKEIK